MTDSEVKKVNNYPNELNGLFHRFLSLETEYNAIVKKINDEKTALDSQFNQISAQVTKQNQDRYNAEEQKFNSGFYFTPVLVNTLAKWQQEKQKYTILKFAVSGLLLLTMLLIPWYASIIGAVGSWFIFENFEKKFIAQVNLLIPFANNSRTSFTAQEQSQIKNINSELRDEIQIVEQKERNRLTQLFTSLNLDKQKQNQHNAAVLNQKLAELNLQHQQEMNSFLNKANSEMATINSKLTTIKSDLNLLPETFDSNLKIWDSKAAVKNKETIADILRVGQVTLSIKLNSPYSITLPRCIPFVNHTNISFDCNNPQETKEAIRQSHNIISRTLLALPPGKVKLTVIDPQALGANAAPFTPLEKEIGGGLASNQNSDIENKLASVIRNIERIIQQCLQNKYADLAAYNNAIKDVQENYNLLVIYNFPNGFDDSAIKKILNIIKSGPKAGVNCIFINDRNAKTTYGLKWSDFDALQTTKLSVQSGTKGNMTFENDKSLPHDVIVDYINKEYPNTNSLKVPFSKYLLPESNWWQSQSHDNLEVPVGKFGADIQSIKFLTAGSESKSNALLIGKMGSGKSNLLHVIIANAITKYSPEQLEIYLIDFKGGVEFVSYADNYIPHIRAIAIDSEREFGLSVLEKVEREMLDRQKEFNTHSIQNLIQYQSKFPNNPKARVLLIVDEFQKFYSEDDEIKRAVDIRLDNIVKQGRAFGINTLFASQTLGNPSINNSTRELFEIRIALMCAEADGEKIFEDKNKAAKDLVKAGEGIYNDKMGKNGYNKKFQAFYVEDNRSDLNALTTAIERHSNALGNKFSNKSQIVFRSTERALIEKSSLQNFTTIPYLNSKSFHLWLGQPIAIDDDVRAILKRQGGGNMLVVGNDEDVAVRIIFSSITSLLKQPIPKDSVFYFFNFFDSDTEHFTKLNVLFNSFQTKFRVEIIEEKNIKTTLESVKQELDSRQASATSNFSNIFITVASIQRCRVFRKDNYNMTDEAKLFASIIKDGTNKGIHTIIQVDSMDSFGGKIFEDKLLPDFSQRVATQMNSDNSRKLLGNEKAMKLGNNRAYYFWDSENKLIKFKPYELPDINFFKTILNSIPNK
ncbi:MAG: hypothetical protein JNL49_04985 [Bacteroidia bacterium]|nr:hypothetical protein [Bacteroidia bacterium]